MKIYLAGPISGCDDGSAMDWREDIKTHFGAENCLDPMRRDYRGREDENIAEIVELDKKDIIEASVVLVNAWKVSPGTSMEIMYAWDHNIPVITVMPNGQFVSPWIRYHSMMIVPTLRDAVVALETIDKYQEYR